MNEPQHSTTTPPPDMPPVPAIDGQPQADDSAGDGKKNETATDPAEDSGKVLADENEETDRPQLPTLSDVLRIASLDRRVGHYIIDLLSGTPADEAFSAHFQPTTDTDEQEARLAEAEERGYLRGRNERIQLEMRRPAASPDNASDVTSDYSAEFLSSTRPNAWSGS